MCSDENRLPSIILYHYIETRAGGNAAVFLDGFDEGTYVMVDGYSGYNKHWIGCHPYAPTALQTAA